MNGWWCLCGRWKREGWWKEGERMERRRGEGVRDGWLKESEGRSVGGKEGKGAKKGRGCAGKKNKHS